MENETRLCFNPNCDIKHPIDEMYPDPQEEN